MLLAQLRSAWTYMRDMEAPYVSRRSKSMVAACVLGKLISAILYMTNVLSLQLLMFTLLANQLTSTLFQAMQTMVHLIMAESFVPGSCLPSRLLPNSCALGSTMHQSAEAVASPAAEESVCRDSFKQSALAWPCQLKSALYCTHRSFE